MSNTNAVSGDSTIDVIVYSTFRNWGDAKFDYLIDKINKFKL
jgi:hypothetical protein